MNRKEYEEVMEVLNDLIHSELDPVEKLAYHQPDFKMEYAHESLTERNSKFKRRNPKG